MDTRSTGATMRAAPQAAQTQVLSGVRELAARYDALLLDQWGVLHDGAHPLPGALDCLAQLRLAGKRVVILSNSGRSGDANARAMRRFGITAAHYDAVVTAGDDAREAFRARTDRFHRTLGRRALVIARAIDVGQVADFGLVAAADAASADLVLVLSVEADGRTARASEALLAAARERDLPMVCANPDVTVVSHGEVIDGPGAIARRYGALGGRVRYHGKPDRGVYDLALAVLARLGIAVARAAAVGDSMLNDVAGAHGAGLACALVAGGIHRDALGVTPGQLPDAAHWTAFLAGSKVVPEYLIASFVW
ncbi:MAG: TIGR01459 family HAD-type hydrolase [Burkholderiales bacterium]|nr:TIGR01459 family HAD-type hydrolase [Burkholderiales bacterium]